MLSIRFVHFAAVCLMMVFLSLAAKAQDDNVSSAPPKVVRSDRPPYQLVYWRERPGQFDYSDRDRHRVRRVAAEAFIDDLNEKGKGGYRLISVLVRELVGLVGVDELPYEYQAFETTAGTFFDVGALDERLEDAMSKNESLVSHARLDPTCIIRNPDLIALGEDCEYPFRFLTEKRPRVSHQTIVGTMPGWGRSPTADLESAIAAKLKEGYYPVRIISRFAILLQKVGKEDELDASTVKLLRTDGNTKNLLKSINRFAAEGYRIALIDDGTALMIKPASTPTTYHFLEGDSKDFAKRFERISPTVKFVTTYPDRQGSMNGLVFESLKPGEKSREYRFLPFDIEYKENSTKDRILAALKPDEVQFDKMVTDLVMQGFRPRTLFVSRPYALLMELHR